MRWRALLIVAVTLFAAACAGPERYDAAGDVHALLIAIRDGDQAGFDAHVDRPALKSQLRARLMVEVTRRSSGDATLAALGAMVGRPLADTLADALIQPDVFRAVAEYLGYSPDRPIPGQLVIAQSLKRVDDARVCIPKTAGGPCVLIFTNEDHTWRLTGFEGDLGDLKPRRR
jgi:hypothetical protein